MEVSLGVRSGSGNGASPVGGALPFGARKQHTPYAGADSRTDHKTEADRKETVRSPSFESSLQPFASPGSGQPGGGARLSADALALLQQAGSEGDTGSLPPLGPQLPPLGESAKETSDSDADSGQNGATGTDVAVGETKLVETRSSTAQVALPTPLNAQALYSYQTNLQIAQAASAARTYLETLDSRTGATTELVA